jgi:WD40 repeat protein
MLAPARLLYHLLLVGVLLLPLWPAAAEPVTSPAPQASALPITLQPQIGHGLPVTGLHFSPDGKTLLSTSFDQTLRLWELSSGRLLRIFRHPSLVLSGAFSPDGHQLASATANGEIYLWHAETGQLQKTLSGHSQSVNRVSFSPDGQHLLSGSEDQTLRLWNVASGELEHILSGHRAPVTSASFSRDGLWVLSGSEDRTIRLWEVNRGALRRSFLAHGSAVTAVAFSPNGQYWLSAGKDQTLKIWNIASGQVSRVLKHASSLHTALFSADSQQVITGASDDVLRFWNLQSGQLVRSLSDPGLSPDSLALSPDGRQLAVAGWRKQIQLWNLASGQKQRVLTGKTVPISHVQFDSTHQQIMAGGDSGEFQLWNLRTGKQFSQMKLDGIKPLAIRLDAQDTPLVLTEGPYNSLMLLDLKNGQLRHHLLGGHTDTPRRAALSPDGRYALSSDSKAVFLWNLASGRLEQQFYGMEPDIGALSFSPDSRYFLAGGARGNITLQPYNEQMHKLMLKGHSENINALAFSPDGQFALSGSTDTRVMLWSLKADKNRWLPHEPREILTGHSEAVTAVAFSPDGRFGLSGSKDGVIKLWRLWASQPPQTLSGHQAEITTVQFSPDGKLLLSSDRDGILRVWKASSGELLYAATAQSGGAYLTWTGEGYFNGSAAAQQGLVHVVQGLRSWNLNAFFNRLHHPGIVEARMKNQYLPPVPPTAKALSPPPEVAFLSPVRRSDGTSNAETRGEGELVVRIKGQDRGGGISRLTLYHNGKALGGNQRGIAGIRNSEGALTQEFLVTLLPGLNTLRAVAYSRDLSESTPVELEVMYHSPKQRRPVLHLLTLGVNRYANPRYNLNFARADAEGFEQVIQTRSRRLFSQIESERLFDEEATKSELEARLRRIQQRARPEDVLIIFYAGHGVALEDEFYFTGSGVTQLYGNDERLKEHSLSSSELRMYLQAIQARKQLVIIDACQSGAAVAQLAQRGAAEERALAQLSRASGVFVLSASSNTQTAAEMQSLGHGLFTWALLEGLEGKARRSEGKITIKDLSAWLDEQVPLLSQRYYGTPQYPKSFFYGEDFPLVLD